MGKRFLGLLAAIVVALVLAVGIAALLYESRTRDQIYPGVSVCYGAGRGLEQSDGLVQSTCIDLGKMTVDEAAATLALALPAPESQGVELHAGERFWDLTWAEVGQRYDYEGMAEAAYAAGRDAKGLAQLLDSLRLRSEGYAVSVQIIPADPDKVSQALARLAGALYIPPAEAKLQLGAGNVSATPGEAGQHLNIEASTARVLQALAEGQPTVALVLDPIDPTRADAEPAYSHAQALLAQPFTLIADDPLTGDYYAEFAAPPEQVATWLYPQPEAERIELAVYVESVRAWLEGTAPHLDEARILDVAATLTRTLDALNAGEHQAQAQIRHPSSTYIVQPGDNFFDIAYSYGFTQWNLEQANPDVDPGVLYIGQPLTIPSIDILFPHPLVPGKRIEIDLPGQQLRAYEANSSSPTDTLTFDFIISSGMSKTPTIAGQFQVLFKEPDAFARRWNLDMPYFMGIYEEGEGFHNGIHELPITAWDRRLSAGVLGWPASYGCIILDVGDAEALYNWAPVGTLVRIEGVAPGTPTWQETLEDIAPPVDPPEE